MSWFHHVCKCGYNIQDVKYINKGTILICKKCGKEGGDKTSKKSFKVGAKELGRFIKMRKSIIKNRILKKEEKNGNDI